jgi:nucleotide-binding universal stress UspA family protein
MYKNILVTLDGTSTDRVIIDHVIALARLMRSHVVLFHVADGWAARRFGPDAVSPEITQDNQYLEKVKAEFKSSGVHADAELTYGEPAQEIVKRVNQGGCDLVAMTTHGHRFVADLFLGTTVTRVRHRISIPVLLLKAK